MMWRHILGCSVIVGSIIAPPALVVQAQSVPSIDELFEEGNAAQAAGKYAEAEAIWRRVLDRDPENASAYTNLGNALGNQGRYEEAEAAYREAIALDPDSARVHYNLGVVLGNQGRYEEEEVAYREAIALAPNDAFAYSNLGVTLEFQERYEEAEAAHREAIALDPDNARVHYNLGVVLRKQGRNEEAEAAYREAIALDPNFAPAHTGLGVALEFQERYEEAEAAHKESIALDPNDARAHYNLGVALSNQGRYEEAEAAYREAIALDPNYVLAYTNLGVALEFQERYEEAEAAHREAIALDPNLASAYYNLGVALSNQGRYEEAEAAYREAIALDPNDSLAYSNWGYVLQVQERYEEAIELYQQAIELDPDLQIPQNNLQEAQRLLALRDNSQPPVFDDSDWLPQNEPLVPVLRAVVRIIAETSSGASIGTGWVVKREGNQLWVVTNRHVLTGEQSTRLSDTVEVEFYSQPPQGQYRLRRPADIRHSTTPTDDEDLALIVVQEAPNDIQPLNFSGSNAGLVLREDIVVVGHPSTGIAWTVDEGLVSNQDAMEIQISGASLAPGSSGSPILNEQNQVVGILYQTRDSGDPGSTAGFGFAYQIDVLLNMLRQWNISL